VSRTSSPHSLSRSKTPPPLPNSSYPSTSSASLWARCS
jgi:hypothetical protein